MSLIFDDIISESPFKFRYGVKGSNDYNMVSTNDMFKFFCMRYHLINILGSPTEIKLCFHTKVSEEDMIKNTLEPEFEAESLNVNKFMIWMNEMMTKDLMMRREKSNNRKIKRMRRMVGGGSQDSGMNNG